MKKGYLAGDMLQKGNAILRQMERKELEKISGIDWYNPVDNDEINDKSKNPTAEEIFWGDTNAILESDVIVMDIANTSVGTTAEAGIIWGLNYMITRLNYIFTQVEDIEDEKERNRLIVESVKKLLKEVPYKKVYWQTTDLRDETTTPEVGIRRSHSYNQYLIGMMLDMAGEPMKFEKIVDTLKKEIQ